MPTLPLFTDLELERAERIIQERTTLPINRAIWFSNSLHALLRDADRAQSATPPAKILAVDTTDLIAGISYSRTMFSAFTFGDLTAEEGDDSPEIAPEYKYISNTELETLDKLILQHLLVHRKEKYLLLDPYAEEIRVLRNARKRDLMRTGGRLFNAHLESFSGFKAENFENLQEFILSRSSADMTGEWDIFCKKFLPNWRSDMLDTLWEKSESFKSVQMLIKHGNFFYWRPLEFGARSILNVFPIFSWSDYREFIKEPAVEQQYSDIHQSIQRLMGKVNRIKSQSKVRRDRSAERDARAFATVHTLNSFFHNRKINARVELVSRSPALHSVIAALPEHRLDPSDDRRFHVTLRHPFLLPDIYGFDAQSLAAIAGVLKGLDAVISRYVTSEGSIKRQAYVDMSANMKEAKKAARDVIPFLRDILAIQQGLEQPSPVVQQIYERTVTEESDRHRSRRGQNRLNGESAVLVEKLKAAFQAITGQLRSRTDPFTREATFALIERNSALVDFEAEQVFMRDAGVTFRVFDLRNDEDQASRANIGNRKLFGPKSCLTVRTIDPAGATFSRLMVVHSEKMIDLLSENLSRQSDFHDETRPTEMQIPVSKILDAVKQALESLVEDSTSSSIVFNLDATLLACLIFASKFRFDTAISLASTILHPITTEIREGRDRSTCRSDDVRLSLAYRELFLLRHYCERGLAMKEYFSPNIGNVSVSKNFARAQRDLDFAMLMAEDAERVLTNNADERSIVPPEGVEHFRDFRLSLAQLAAWTDQYLIIADIVSKNEIARIDWQDSELQTLRKRIGIWAAAGFVREALVDAHEAKARRLALSGVSRYEANERRYLAYVETRALQGALTVFLVFLAYKIAPEMHEFWQLGGPPKRDRVLLFRGWREWWDRYTALREKYGFSVRADGLIVTVCKALEAIAAVRRQTRENAEAQSSESARKEAHTKILFDLRNELEAMIDTKNSSQFVRAIGAATIERLNAILA